MICSGLLTATDPLNHTTAQVAVDHSGIGAVYKGLAIASTLGGDFLYATDFHNGHVDVFDGSFHQVNTPGAFVDPNIPGGYGPFGIQNLGGTIFVSYAKQDADRHDDVAGQGHGFVDMFECQPCPSAHPCPKALAAKQEGSRLRLDVPEEKRSALARPTVSIVKSTEICRGPPGLWLLLV